MKLRGPPIGIEGELICVDWAAKTLQHSLTQHAAEHSQTPAIDPDSAPAKFPNPTSFSLNSTTTTSVSPFCCCHRAQSTATTPHTVKMAAFIKAINAKIRSNKYSDYICSTRT